MLRVRRATSTSRRSRSAPGRPSRACHRTVCATRPHPIAPGCITKPPRIGLVTQPQPGGAHDTRGDPDRLAEDGVHPVRVQLRASRCSSADDGGRQLVKHPGRQAPTRPRAATRARRRSASTTTRTAAIASTTPLRRRPDGTFEAIDWDTAIREVAARLRGGARHARRRRRSSITAAAARGTTSPARTRRRRGAALGTRYRSNALAQEKTGEFWVNGQHDGRRRPRRLRALRGRAVPRQEPVAVARLPPRARDAQGDRARSRARR